MGALLAFALVFIYYSWRIGKLPLPAFLSHWRRYPPADLQETETYGTASYKYLASSYTPIQRDIKHSPAPQTRDSKISQTRGALSANFYAPNIGSPQPNVHEMSADPETPISKASLWAQATDSRPESLKKPKRPPKTAFPQVQQRRPLSLVIPGSGSGAALPIGPISSDTPDSMARPVELPTNSQPVLSRPLPQKVLNQESWPKSPLSTVSAPSTYHPLSSHANPPSPLSSRSKGSFKVVKKKFSIPRKPLPTAKNPPSRQGSKSSLASSNSFRSINSWLNHLPFGRSNEPTEAVPVIPAKYRIFPLPPRSKTSQTPVMAADSPPPLPSKEGSPKI